MKLLQIAFGFALMYGALLMAGNLWQTNTEPGIGSPPPVTSGRNG